MCRAMYKGYAGWSTKYDVLMKDGRGNERSWRDLDEIPASLGKWRNYRRLGKLLVLSSHNPQASSHDLALLRHAPSALGRIQSSLDRR